MKIDTNSETWTVVESELNERLATLRRMLEIDQPELRTANIRTEIRLCKALLDLPSRKPDESITYDSLLG